MTFPNILVDKIKSIVAFKMSELVLILRDEFTYNSVLRRERVGIF